MAYKEFYWITKDQFKLFAQAWTPEGEIKAVLALVHGLGEHSGRYQDVANELNQEGYALIGFALRGHGRSEGPRGHFSYTESLDDVDRLIDEAQKLLPGKPVYLYRHSMGGNLVLYYAIKRLPTCLNGIISTSPALGTARPVAGCKIALVRVMKGISPMMTMNNDLDLAGLSTNPNIIAAYKSDPLVHPLISARLGWDLLQSGPWLIEHAAEFPSIPLLIMQGSADRIVDPAATKKFVKKVKGDITFHLWAGDYHELHNEPNRDEVFKFLLQWLEKYSLLETKPSAKKLH